MVHLLDIIKYTLPALVVFLTAYLILKKYIDKENSQLKHELKLKNREQILPLRIQAYERLGLLLERMAMDNLLMRVNKPDYTVNRLQSEMIAAIRGEFDHNLTQQIYVSQQLWELIRGAKENSIRIINETAAGLDKDSPAIYLSKALLDHVMKEEATLPATALGVLKKEIDDRF